jgi:uncharacterized protein with GYD domain
MLFIMTLNFTEEGIRTIKDSLKRQQGARDLGKKMGIDVKQIYLTSGESDLVALVEAPNGDAMATFALAIGSLGFVRSRTARAWTSEEFQKIVNALP